MKKLLFLILVSILPVACEFTTDSLDLPFEERLVIDGTVSVGRASVYVGKTLPLDEDGPIHRRNVPDAIVRLLHDGSNYPLTYDAQVGSYYNDSFPIFAGGTYTLTVEWNDKRAWASTRIPLSAQIDTIVLRSDTGGNAHSYTAEAVVTPRTDEVYIPYWYVYNSRGQSAIHEVFRDHDPLRLEDAGSDGRVRFSYKFETDNAIDSVQFDCLAYDKVYYDYYISRGNPDFSGVPIYSYFEGPVRWNVHGDGVGLFVGRSSGFRTAYPW